MTRAVPIFPGALYFVTRRTHSRRYRLKPDPQTEQLVEYCLAVASRKYGVGVVGFVVMSNHWHAILLDHHGNHRQFVQWVNAMIARALNARQGRRDAFWSSSRNAPVLLLDRDAVLRKLVYIMTNPIEANLVRRASDWPGLLSLPKDLVRLRPRVARPREFFRAEGQLPETATLRLVNPRLFGFGRMSGKEIRSFVGKAVEEREKELDVKRRLTGQAVIGNRKLRKQSPFAFPRTAAPLCNVSPRVATRDTDLRIKVLAWLKGFVASHREAFERLRHGRRRPTFPFGTDLYRRIYGFECLPQPSDFPIQLLS